MHENLDRLATSIIPTIRLYSPLTRETFSMDTHTGLKRQTVLDKHGIYIKAVKRRPR